MDKEKKNQMGACGAKNENHHPGRCSRGSVSGADEAGCCPRLEQLSLRGGAPGCCWLLRTKSGSLADVINRYCVISFLLSCGVLLSIFLFISQIQLEFNYQLFFAFLLSVLGWASLS